MTIYILTILISFLLAIFEVGYLPELHINKQLRISFFLFFGLITFSFLVFQVGCRWETGTDWEPYLNHFLGITNFNSTSIGNTGFEFGYSFLVWLSKFISPEYSVFLLLHALVLYLLLFDSFKLYSGYLFLPSLLFYVSTIGVLGSNRQLLAVAICLYSLRFVVNKNPFYFFILVFIAFNIHSSALLFLIYYFINRRINIYVVLLVLFSCFVLGKSSLPFGIFSFLGNVLGGESADKALIYLEGAQKVLAEYQLSLLGFIKRLAFLALFFYNRDKINDKLKFYNIMLNGYIVGIGFYFLFSESLLVMVSRGSLYFNMTEPLLLACQFSLIKERRAMLLSFIGILLFSFFTFFQSISPYKDLFIPYKGIFINSDYYREMH